MLKNDIRGHCHEAAAIAATRPNLNDAGVWKIALPSTIWHDMIVRQIHQPLRRLPLAKKAEVDEMIDEMQRHGFIEESTRPWSTVITFVRKTTGNRRFCVNCRELSEATRKNCFPLRRIDNSWDTMTGDKWFSTLHLESDCCRVDLDPGEAKVLAVFGHVL
jgi:hypothetical protein